MTTILTECANKMVEKMMNLIIGETYYVCCFKCIVEDFEKEKKELNAKWMTVGKDVENAKGRADNIREDVLHWQGQAENLIKEDTKTKETCFFGWCPNCIWRYQRGKELALKTEDIKRKLKEGNFENVGRPPTLPGVEYHSSQGYIHFESRDLKCKELLAALEDDNNYMAGLQGMGGTGKTTTAIEVGKKLKESKKFDHVIFTVVSNAPDIKKIQDGIAGPLGLSLKDKSEWERPKILWNRLTDGQKILIILDDVWELISFQEIGIPLIDNHKGCRVLLTTRNVRVCNLMGCQRTIQLELLSVEDAWKLFKERAGISDNSSKNLQKKGREIAKECKGLPVAIAALASTLKGQRHVEEWKAALTALQNPKPMHGVDESLIETYKCLRYSYDYMKSEKAQELFLLCSVFQEDEEVPPEILTRFAIGVGLFDEVDTYDEARNQVHVAKNKLVDSCLLLEDEEGCVKMHDLVREVALWIANNEIQVVMLSDKNQKALAEKEKNIKYLLCDGRDMDVFSNWFDGAKLEILLVRIDADDSVNVPTAFFEKMTRLRVLHLYCNSWQVVLSLPQSILSLTNIRSLFLEDWKLGDISILGNLRSLETLDLAGCSISELPNKITELEKLRLLKLNDCKIERNNPFEVIEKCSLLEELYFEGNDILQLDNVNDAEAIHHNRTSLTLQKYRLTEFSEVYDSISKCVTLSNVDALISEATFKYLARAAEILELEEIKGEWRNVIPEIVPMEAEAINDLVKLGLASCSKVQCLIDTKHISSRVQNVFPKLVQLELKYMDNLEELCSGSFPLDFLKSLERLLVRNCEHLGSMLFKSKLNLCNVKIMKLEGCPMLTSIFQWSTARSLVLLENLRIRRCEQLTNIIITDERSGDENREEAVDGDNDHKRPDGDPMFPKLKTLEIEKCNRLEFILPVLSAQDVPLLEVIKIDDCGELKYIFGQYKREDQELQQEVKNVVLSSLKEIALHGLPNFIDIFPECYHPMSSSVKRSCSRDGSVSKQSDRNKYNIFLWSHICCYAHKLRSARRTNIPIISEDGQPGHFISSTLNSEGLLHRFESAQCISKSKLSLILLLRDVREVNLKVLPTIKFLFTMSIAQTMLVEKLRIEECHEVKHIVADMGDDQDRKNYDSIFPKLKVLSVSNCDQLEYILGQCHNLGFHIDLPALEELTLRSLPKIINICPRNYCVIVPRLKVFNFDGCPQFPIKSINDFLVSLNSRQLDGTTTEDLRRTGKHLLTLENLYVRNSEVECMFCVDELQITQQIMNLGLQYLKLDNLSQMTNICMGPGNSFTLQNLEELQIVGCEKLKVIFPGSIKRWLPQLARLEIRECKELKQIIEEDMENQKLSNLLSPHPCFPELKVLIVKQCNELKRFIPVSVSNELPKLELLIVKEALKLEEVFGCDKTGELKIELPNLKLVMFMQLPSLCQGIELQTVRHRVVHNCPKLSLSSTAHTGKELQKNLEDSKDYMIGGFPDFRLANMLDELTQETSNQNPTAETTSEFQVGPEVEAASGSEFPSSQINTNQSMQANGAEYTQNDNGIGPLKTKTEQTPDPKFSPIASPNLKESNEVSEFVGKVPGSEMPPIATSTDSELVGRTSPSPLDNPLHKTHAHELVDEQLAGEPFLMKQQQPIEETEINIQNCQGNNSLRETEDESFQEGSKSEKTVTATLSGSTDSETRDSPLGPLPASIQKSVKRRAEEGITSEKTKVVTSSEQASSPSGPLVTSRHNTYPHRNEELEKEFVGKILISEIPAIATSPTDLELVERSYPSPLDIPLHKTHSYEMVDGQSIGEPKPPGETESNIEIPQGNNCLKETEDQSLQEGSESEKTVTATPTTDSETRNTSPEPLLAPFQKSIKRGVEGGTIAENAKIVTSSTQSEPTSSLSGPLATSQHNRYPHSEIMLSQTEAYIDKESEGDPINIEYFGDDDLVSLIQPEEEDDDGQITTPSVSDSVFAADHPGTKDNLVAKVLADLEVSLKMPLKVIACSEANSLHLMTALNFLSHLSLEDVALSDGLKAITHSLHQHFPSILCSFKQAFATTNKFAVLEEKEKSIKEELAQRKGTTTALVSKISKAKKFMDEAQQKEAILKEQIHRLEKEIKDWEAKLSSLEEEKKKCVAETIGCKKEFEGVRKDKSQMVEDQRKARQELFEVDYKWSTLCSQFEHNRIAAGNLS